MKAPLLGALALFVLAGHATAAELPEWARGWVVASVIIPADGDLQDAYVDFQTPAGELVTLAAGAQVKDGLSVESVEWVGAPVRAKVRLVHGEKSADLFADPALVAKSTVEKKARKFGRQIEIAAKFIEVTEALAHTLKDPAGHLLFAPDAAGKGAKTGTQIVAMLRAGEEPGFVAGLQKLAGADVLSAPQVVTRSGQRAVIEIIREIKYPTAWEKDSYGWVPTAFEVRNVGVTLEVEPSLAVQNVIALKLVPQVVEHLGWADVETGQPVKSMPDRAKIQEAGGARMEILSPVSHGRGRLRPVFSDRKITTGISAFSGQTAVLTGFGETEETKPFKPKTPGRRLMLIITARQLTPE